MSFSEYRGSYESEQNRLNRETYNVAGVTYDITTRRPVDFSSEYTGPKNALVGIVTARKGVEYGVYADYKQTNNEIRTLDSSNSGQGTVVYKGFTQSSEGEFADGYSSKNLNSDDVKNVQGTIQKAVDSGNIYDPTYGTGIPSGDDLPPGSFGISEEGRKQAQLNRDEYNYGLPELKFGAVDHILQRLSLRNLTYPLDADYGNTQDYMMINQFTYRPPNKDLIFPNGTRPGFKNAVDSFVTGVPQGTPKEKAIGLVKLPMPNTLEDSNNVSWGEDKLNALTAAATSAAMGVSADAIRGIGDFLATADQRGMGENFNELLRRLQSGAGKVVSDIGNATSGFQMNENVRLLGQTLVGSTLLNALQFQVSPETILARGAGVVPNNNLALLFNSPTLREFKFSWKMSPRSKEEAIRINNILRFFKQGMAPKKGITSNSRSGGGSYFLGTPNIFDLSFKTARTKNSFWEILDRNDSVMRIKTCACTGAAVNYTPEGMWNAYEKGQPVAITLTLRFNELEPIFDTDYDDNYFNYDPQRTDLLPVPMDAVGY
tara:strand:- start:222 stop:1856 length:1635 start_codon:yes stop_codon:yes gene_type:complete